MDPITNGTPNPVATSMSKKNSKLTTIVILLALILLALLAINMVTEKKEKAVDQAIMQKQAEIQSTDETTKQIQMQSTSDATVDIQKDLNATNVDSINLQ